MADNPYAWLRRYQDVLVCEDMVTGIKCPVWVGIHTDKAWNHQVLDKPFDKIEDLTVGKFSFNEDGTLGVYWECGGASTMCTIMDFVEDKVAI